MKPKATKTSLARLLIAKGCSLPRLKDTLFSSVRYAFFLRWVSDDGSGHEACYSAAAGRPVLMVDRCSVPLSLSDVMHYGMVAL